MFRPLRLPFQDNPVGRGDGEVQGRRLFRTRPGHASLVPLEGLLKAEVRPDTCGEGWGEKVTQSVTLFSPLHQYCLSINVKVCVYCVVTVTEFTIQMQNVT